MAIQARDIARAVGCRGKYADRPVWEAIRQLRQEGHLILSSFPRYQQKRLSITMG